ncbi:MAG: RNA polymerase sigma factor, partial [Clostridium sp.]
MQQEEINKRIDQAVQGDRSALEEVLAEIQDMVFNLSLRMLGTIADAQDATQEILIKVMTSISTFRKESKFQTWVYRIAVNYLMDVRSSMFAQHPLDFDFYANDLRASYVPDEEEALTGCTREEAARELKLSCTNVMLQCLKPQDRCIYILGTMFHIDSRSAAEILDMTPEAYRQRLSRARKRMAAFLSEYCGAVSNGFCQCDKRIPYAVMTHRLQPQNLEYSRLKT